MNNIQIVRKFKRMTQEEVAKKMNITQSTYSYWESGKVNVDAKSMSRLADLFHVSVDFLSGRRYTKLNRPYETWRKDEVEDYENANTNDKKCLEYIFGQPIYDDSHSLLVNNSIIGDNNSNCLNTANCQLTEMEEMILANCKKMDRDQKFRVLEFTREILAKQNKKPCEESL